MPLLDELEVKAEFLPSVPLDLTPADVAAIQPALQLALCRIEELRLSGAAGFATSDAGAFAGRRYSAEMHARLRAAYDKLDGPGPIEVDDLELRILAFGARMGQRHLTNPAPVPDDLEDKLENTRKRAKRSAKSAVGEEQYRELSQIWGQFRQWCRDSVFESPKHKATKRRAQHVVVANVHTPGSGKRPIVALQEIAGSVINPESKLAADPERLRKELSSFLREVKRGRWDIDLEDIFGDQPATKAALVEYLYRRSCGWDLRREFQDLSIQQSTDAAKARRFMDRSAEVDELERAAEASERAAEAAATMKQQQNATVPVLTTPNTTAANGPASQPLPPQQEPSRNELKLLFANWLINDVLPEARFTVFKEALTRLHHGQDLPLSAGRFSFADCRPIQRGDRVKFYTEWVLAWLLSWTTDMEKAKEVIGMGLEYARLQWISMSISDRERIVAEIHLRHFQ